MHQSRNHWSQRTDQNVRTHSIRLFLSSVKNVVVFLFDFFFRWEDEEFHFFFHWHLFVPQSHIQTHFGMQRLSGFECLFTVSSKHRGSASSILRYVTPVVGILFRYSSNSLVVSNLARQLHLLWRHTSTVPVQKNIKSVISNFYFYFRNVIDALYLWIWKR